MAAAAAAQAVVVAAVVATVNAAANAVRVAAVGAGVIAPLDGIRAATGRVLANGAYRETAKRVAAEMRALPPVGEFLNYAL